jgi:hypothetical protein
VRCRCRRIRTRASAVDRHAEQSGTVRAHSDAHAVVVRALTPHARRRAGAFRRAQWRRARDALAIQRTRGAARWRGVRLHKLTRQNMRVTSSFRAHRWLRCRWRRRQRRRHLHGRVSTRTRRLTPSLASAMALACNRTSPSTRAHIAFTHRGVGFGVGRGLGAGVGKGWQRAQCGHMHTVHATLTVGAGVGTGVGAGVGAPVGHAPPVGVLSVLQLLALTASPHCARARVHGQQRRALMHAYAPCHQHHWYRHTRRTVVCDAARR